MLELKNVSFEVSDEKAQKEIIRGINLKIDDNKFVVITGPNGGGKSTLAKLIVGIEKPTSGQILFNGEDITEKSITERAKMGISFAFQQPVRFKGIQVLDLIRMAAGRRMSAADACTPALMSYTRCMMTGGVRSGLRRSGASGSTARRAQIIRYAGY